MLFDKAIKNQLKFTPKYKLARPKSNSSSDKQPYLPITKLRKDLDESLYNESILKLPSRPATSTSTRKTLSALSALSRTSTKIRPISSPFLIKRDIKHENFQLTKPRSPSPFKEKQPQHPQQKSTISVTRELELNDFCAEPKYPRLTSYFSIDAQLAMLVTYEELVRELLLFKYPHCSFELANGLSFELASNNKMVIDKIKISHFMNAAMKIIDILKKDSKEYDPLFLYNQWVYLCNKEFFT
jgi:hypothetical protein